MSRRSLLATLAVIFALLAIWLSAPSWISLMIRNQLHRTGYDHVTCDIASVTWNTAHIRDFHLQQNSSLTIDVRDAVVSYSLLGLLRQRLTDITVGSLAVAVRSSQRTVENGGFVISSPLAFLRQIPLTTASIQSIHLRHLNDRQQQDIELKGFAKYRHGAINFQLRNKKQEARLTLDQSGNFIILLQQNQQQAFSAHGTLHSRDNHMEMDAETDINLAEINVMFLSWGLVPDLKPKGSIHAKWHASLPRNQVMRVDNILSRLKLNAEIVANFSTQSSTIKANLTGNIDLDKGQGLWTIKDRSRLRFGKPGKQTEMTFTQTSGAIVLVDQHPNITIHKHTRVTAQKYKINDLNISGLSMILAKDVSVRTFPTPELLKPTEIVFHLPSLQWKEGRLKIPKISLLLSSGTIESVHGSLHANSLHLLSTSGHLDARHIQIDFQRIKNTFSGQWQAGLANLARINGDFSVDVPERHGAIHFKMKPLDIKAKQPVIKSLTLPDPMYPSLQSGILASSGEVKWNDSHATARIRLSADALSGTFHEMKFHGLSTQGTLIYDGRKMTVRADPVKLTSLQAGIPIENITFRASMRLPAGSKPVIVIRNFRAELLGGSAFSQAIPLDLNRAHNPFSLHLKDIDIKELIALEKQEGLDAGGRINGSLPLDLVPEGLFLRDGELHAKPPGGMIRYLGSASVQSMAATNMAVKTSLAILSDFHYQSMRVLANYRPSGELNLRLQLKGRNPSYQSGRPIVLNLNVDENVLDLIKSLQLTGKIEKKVQKRLRKK